MKKFFFYSIISFMTGQHALGCEKCINEIKEYNYNTLKQLNEMTNYFDDPPSDFFLYKFKFGEIQAYHKSIEIIKKNHVLDL